MVPFADQPTIMFFDIHLDTVGSIIIEVTRPNAICKFCGLPPGVICVNCKGIGREKYGWTLKWRFVPLRKAGMWELGRRADLPIKLVLYQHKHLRGARELCLYSLDKRLKKT